MGKFSCTLKILTCLSIFIAIILAASVEGKCQEFMKGYIVNSDGQRISGYIQNNTTIEQYFGCLYKGDQTSEPIYFSIDQINEYGLENGKILKKRNVNLAGNTQNLFLKLEESGLVSIYSSIGRYFIEKGAEIVEFELGVANAARNNFLFRRLLSDCERSAKRLGSRFSNDIKYIQALINSYNNCNEVDPNTFQSIHLNLAAILGIESSSLLMNTDGAQLQFIDRKKVQNHNLLISGINLKFSHKKLKSLTFNSGVFYAERSFFAAVYNPQPKRIDQIRFQYKSIWVPALLQLKLHEAHFTKQYIAAGIRLPIAFDKENYWIAEEDFGPEVIITKAELFPGFKEPVLLSINYGVVFRVSQKFSLLIETMIYTGKQNSKSDLWKSSVQSSGLGIHVGLVY